MPVLVVSFYPIYNTTSIRRLPHCDDAVETFCAARRLPAQWLAPPRLPKTLPRALWRLAGRRRGRLPKPPRRLRHRCCFARCCRGTLDLLHMMGLHSLLRLVGLFCLLGLSGVLGLL
jgi:hypothetical protein